MIAERPVHGAEMMTKFDPQLKFGTSGSGTETNAG
jgi:hypothetical protein